MKKYLKWLIHYTSTGTYVVTCECVCVKQPEQDYDTPWADTIVEVEQLGIWAQSKNMLLLVGNIMDASKYRPPIIQQPRAVCIFAVSGTCNSRSQLLVMTTPANSYC